MGSLEWVGDEEKSDFSWLKARLLQFLRETPTQKNRGKN